MASSGGAGGARVCACRASAALGLLAQRAANANDLDQSRHNHPRAEMELHVRRIMPHPPTARRAASMRSRTLRRFGPAAARLAFRLMSKTEVRLSCAEVIIRIIRPWLVPAPTRIIRRRFVVPSSAIAHAAPPDLFGFNGVGTRQNIERAGLVAEGHRIRLDQNRKEGAGRRCRQKSELAHDFLPLSSKRHPADRRAERWHFKEKFKLSGACRWCRGGA
jgi:hypothetical protein